MRRIRVPKAVGRSRRSFLGTAATTLAASQFGVTGSAAAQSGKANQVAAIKPGTHTSFASLKQIDAAVLNTGYAEAGAADAPAVILLHGWPYDIHSYVDVTPLLASAGYRVIVPPDIYRHKFSGKYAHRLVTGGIGHNLPQEAPQAFAQAVVDVDAF